MSPAYRRALAAFSPAGTRKIPRRRRRTPTVFCLIPPTGLTGRRARSRRSPPPSVPRSIILPSSSQDLERERRDPPTGRRRHRGRCRPRPGSSMSASCATRTPMIARPGSSGEATVFTTRQSSSSRPGGVAARAVARVDGPTAPRAGRPVSALGFRPASTITSPSSSRLGRGRRRSRPSRSSAPCGVARRRRARCRECDRGSHLLRRSISGSETRGGPRSSCPGIARAPASSSALGPRNGRSRSSHEPVGR